MKKLSFVSILLALSTFASAQTCIDLNVINGTPSGGTPPPGWSIWSSSPDIIAGNGAWPGGYGSYFVEDVNGVSTQGGQMGLFLNNAGGLGEGWQTTLTGLTAGVTYSVSVEWQQATLTNYGSVTYSYGDLYTVVNGVPNTFASVGGLTDPWQTATIVFTASGPTAPFQMRVNDAASGIIGSYGSAIVVDDMVCSVLTVDAGVDQIVCEGSSVMLSASGASSYTWDNGVTDGVAFTPGVGTTTYTVTGYDGTGAAIGTDQLDVTVNPNPIVNAGADQSICDGDAVTLSGAGATSYVWDNGVTNGTAFNPAVGTVTYTVTGTDGNGCVNTDAVDVVVNAIPAVNGGPDLTICEGTSVTLSGSGANSYVWNNGVTDATAFTPAVGTLNYIVTGTSAAGCINTDNVDVTVNPNPIVNAGVDQAVCEGTAITLAGTGAVAYVWDNGVTDNSSFTPAVGNVTYTVVGTDANGCTASDLVDVLVDAIPTVDAGVDQLVCDGTPVTLSASGTNSYVWDNGVTDGVAFTPALGTITYTVTGTSVAGCTNTDMVDVTVNPAPVVNAGVDQTVCAGIAVTLNGSGATSYVWDNGVTDGASFIPSVGTTTYTVTGTTAGCSASDVVNVTVNPIPTISAGADQTICEGDSFTMTTSNPNGAVLVWDNGVTEGLAFNPTATAVYTVTATLNSCTSTDNITISVNPIPSVLFDGMDLSGCDVLPVDFRNLTSTGGTNCFWDFGDGNTSTSCGNQTHTYTSPGVYTVSLTVSDAAGCTGTYSIADYVVVYDSPIAAISANQYVITNFDTEVDFSNQSINGTAYNWTFGNSGSSIEENPLFVFGEKPGGGYNVVLVVTGDGGCTDYTETYITYNEDPTFYVPSTFTPNGDAYNNSFKPVFTAGYDYYDYHMTLFNRWGEVVFESFNSDYGWSGSYGDHTVMDGTYIWQITFKALDSDKKTSIRGHVTVLK